MVVEQIISSKIKGGEASRKVMSGEKKVQISAKSERACVARVHTHCCNRRKRGKLAKQAQGDKQIQRREARRDRGKEEGHEYKRSRV